LNVHVYISINVKQFQIDNMCISLRFPWVFSFYKICYIVFRCVITFWGSQHLTVTITVWMQGKDVT